MLCAATDTSLGTLAQISEMYCPIGIQHCSINPLCSQILIPEICILYIELLWRIAIGLLLAPNQSDQIVVDLFCTFLWCDIILKDMIFTADSSNCWSYVSKISSFITLLVVEGYSLGIDTSVNNRNFLCRNKALSVRLSRKVSTGMPYIHLRSIEQLFGLSRQPSYIKDGLS